MISSPILPGQPAFHFRLDTEPSFTPRLPCWLQLGDELDESFCCAKGKALLCPGQPGEEAVELHDVYIISTCAQLLKEILVYLVNGSWQPRQLGPHCSFADIEAMQTVVGVEKV